MNRLGMEPMEWETVKELTLSLNPVLIMSHLACADEPDHKMNSKQLDTFLTLTDKINIKKSLAATGGILLGPEYHFDLTRPGIGIYGCSPMKDCLPVLNIDIPVIQIRDIESGETVGYGNTWTSPSKKRIATISAGYADGIFRATGQKTRLYFGEIGCPIVGRISMDLIGVDITSLNVEPDRLELINSQQTIDKIADGAGTIGYEFLTSLGQRYNRKYTSATNDKLYRTNRKNIFKSMRFYRRTNNILHSSFRKYLNSTFFHASILFILNTNWLVISSSSRYNLIFHWWSFGSSNLCWWS